MTESGPSRAEIAALNNADWCQTVCASHGVSGGRDESLWWQDGPVPRFYPNAGMLRPAADAEARLGELVAAHSPAIGGAWSAKDSFAAVDLTRFGCRVVFDAQWLWLDPASGVPAAGGWSRVTTAEELRAWEQAWSGDEPLQDDQRIFQPSLLGDANVALWGRKRSPTGPLVAGGVLSRSPGAVGLSNCFSVDERDHPATIAALSQLAANFAPGVPQCGYEQAADCEPYLALGFELAGPLRVWIKD